MYIYIYTYICIYIYIYICIYVYTYIYVHKVSTCSPGMNISSAASAPSTHSVVIAPGEIASTTTFK